MIINTPPLGWNSWNTFANNISDSLIRESAQALVDSGLKDAGYEYIVIDDCWALRQRDENGRLVPDPEKFPEGIRPVADYIHSLGLKFGMYTCVGERTCADFPGSYDHEFVDAASFAEWGVDYLKVDYCFRPRETPGHLLYKRMGTALALCGRDILFSACSWGADGTAEWIKTSGAHVWRSTPDIFDTWESVKKIAMLQTDLQKYCSRGSFNDMDMLVVGMNGKGHVGLTGLTENEYRLHFSLWALLNSPLMLGCDIRNLTPEIHRIISNKDVIAINQDPAYMMPFMVNSCAERPIWVRLLENGDFAIGLFNYADVPNRLHFSIADLGLNRVSGKKLVLTDLWSGEECETADFFCRTLQPHDFLLFRGRVQNV